MQYSYNMDEMGEELTDEIEEIELLLREIREKGMKATKKIEDVAK